MADRAAEALKEAVRRAARRKKLGANAFREHTGLSNGTFYKVWGGIEVPGLDILRKLKDAGVRIPRELKL